MKINTTHNSTYPKVMIQWLNQTLCFYHSLCSVDSEVLWNSHLRVAAKRHTLTSINSSNLVVYLRDNFSCFIFQIRFWSWEANFIFLLSKRLIYSVNYLHQRRMYWINIFKKIELNFSIRRKVNYDNTCFFKKLIWILINYYLVRFVDIYTCFCR